MVVAPVARLPVKAPGPACRPCHGLMRVELEELDTPILSASENASRGKIKDFLLFGNEPI
jgi:hypothetical protein